MSTRFPLRSGLLTLAIAAVFACVPNVYAQSQGQLHVSVSQAPMPDVIKTGQTANAAFSISLTGTQAKKELKKHGADQSYTVSLVNDSGYPYGNPESVSLLGSTLEDNGRVGNFDVHFDRPHSRISISSTRKTALLSMIGVSASFNSPGHCHIVLNGSATIDGNSYSDHDETTVTVVDFHIRADINKDGNYDSKDDKLADNPGLYIPLNTDDDDGSNTPDREQDSQVVGEDDLQTMKMFLDPQPTNYQGGDYFRYVKLTRDNTHTHVWRTSDKSDWNGNGGKILYADNSNTWDLNQQINPDSYAKWSHDKNSLYAEGNAVGATTLTLKLMRNNGQLVLTDTLKTHVWGVELQINKTAKPDDDIVCRYSTSPAGRPEIPCQARVVGAAQQMNVVATNGGASGTGQLRFGTSATNATNTDLTLNLPAGGGSGPGPWTQFYISGQDASQAMRDADIQLHKNTASGTIVNQTPATVLWVTLSWKYLASETISNDDSARNAHHNVYHQYSLGISYSDPPPVNDGRVGWGYEVKGTVMPSDFDQNVTLARDISTRWYLDQNDGSTPANPFTFPANRGYHNYGFTDTIPGNDQGDLIFYDQKPPLIYALDAPGLFIKDTNEPKSTIQRFRGNFHMWGYWKNIRCSNTFPFWFRMSYIQNGSKTTDQWVPLNSGPNAVANDNEAGAGSTHLGPKSTN